ncbi:unnamed protein product [Plasmodium vivax]|uniref:(malaria parasite P. vivax) hypothetical protein n=1 Tax=Plasmodium vivax TaxID=5855 RepID=A0A8S4H9D4_PLAVI|nr:unnamed protein product [Plasmodium vivax]
MSRSPRDADEKQNLPYAKRKDEEKKTVTRINALLCYLTLFVYTCFINIPCVYPLNVGDSFFAFYFTLQGVGSLVLGVLADVYGRAKCLKVCFTILIVSSVLMLFSAPPSVFSFEGKVKDGISSLNEMGITTTLLHQLGSFHSRGSPHRHATQTNKLAQERPGRNTRGYSFLLQQGVSDEGTNVQTTKREKEKKIHQQVKPNSYSYEQLKNGEIKRVRKNHLKRGAYLFEVSTRGGATADLCSYPSGASPQGDHEESPSVIHQSDAAEVSLHRGVLNYGKSPSSKVSNSDERPHLGSMSSRSDKRGSDKRSRTKRSRSKRVRRANGGDPPSEDTPAGASQKGSKTGGEKRRQKFYPSGSPPHGAINGGTNEEDYSPVDRKRQICTQGRSNFTNELEYGGIANKGSDVWGGTPHEECASSAWGTLFYVLTLLCGFLTKGASNILCIIITESVKESHRAKAACAIFSVEHLSMVTIRLVIRLSELSNVHALYKANIFCFTVLSVASLKAVNLLVEVLQRDVCFEQRCYVNEVCAECVEQEEDKGGNLGGLQNDHFDGINPPFEGINICTSPMWRDSPRAANHFANERSAHNKLPPGEKHPFRVEVASGGGTHWGNGLGSSTATSQPDFPQQKGNPQLGKNKIEYADLFKGQVVKSDEAKVTLLKKLHTNKAFWQFKENLKRRKKWEVYHTWVWYHLKAHKYVTLAVIGLTFLLHFLQINFFLTGDISITNMRSESLFRIFNNLSLLANSFVLFFSFFLFYHINNVVMRMLNFFAHVVIIFVSFSLLLFVPSPWEDEFALLGSSYTSYPSSILYVWYAFIFNSFLLFRRVCLFFFSINCVHTACRASLLGLFTCLGHLAAPSYVATLHTFRLLASPQWIVPFNLCCACFVCFFSLIIIVAFIPHVSCSSVDFRLLDRAHLDHFLLHLCCGQSFSPHFFGAALLPAGWPPPPG